MSAGTWAAWAVFVPLVGALVTFVVPRGRGALAAATTLLAALAAVGALVSVAITGPGLHVLGGWEEPLGITLRVDAFAAVLLGTTALVMVPAGLYAGGWLRDRAATSSAGDAGAFWGLWLLLWTGLAALFLSGDLFNLYVTLELVGLSAVALVAVGGTVPALSGALRYLLVSLGGSLAFLLGVALLYGRYGVLDLALLAGLARASGPEPVTWVALVLMTAGLLLKTAIFPLHFWLPAAHGAAPPQVSAVLSGLVVKGGFAILLRLWLEVFPGMAAPVAPVFGALGAGAVVWGGVQALRQTRLKLLVAWSTVAQLGYLLLAFPLATGGAFEAAWGGAAWFVASHGVAKAALFLAAGVLYAANGHDRLGEMRASSPPVRLAWAAFALAGASIAGLPPTGGFAAKWVLLSAAVGTGGWLWAAVLVGGGLLAAAYLMRAIGPAVRNAEAPAPAVAVAVGLGGSAFGLALGVLVLGFAAAWGVGFVSGGAPLEAAAQAAGTVTAWGGVP